MTSIDLRRASLGTFALMLGAAGTLGCGDASDLDPADAADAGCADCVADAAAGPDANGGPAVPDDAPDAGDVETLADAGTGEPDGGADPDCVREYEVIPARGQAITVASGETFENVLFDMSTGQDVVLVAKGTNWTIRNVGFDGENRARTGRAFMGLADTGRGTSTLENVYLGDGAAEGNAQPTGHGATGMWVDPDHNGHLDIRYINVQNMPDNGIYASAPGSNSNGERGTIHIDQSYAANNYVSSFRIGGGSRVTNSVAFNTAGVGYNGRCFWGWPGEAEMRISNCNFSSGPYTNAIHVGRTGSTTRLRIEGTQYDGISRTGDVRIDFGEGNGTTPDLTMPAGVPRTAVEAASRCSE